MPRQGHFMLAFAALEGPTQEHYLQVLDRFSDYCEEFDIDAKEKNMDFVLTDYFKYLFDLHMCMGKDVCQQMQSFFLFLCLELKRQLTLSKKALLGWNRLVPIQQFTPCTRSLAVALAYYGLRYYSFPLALYNLISFDCYLRTSGVANLKWRETIPAKNTNDHAGVLMLMNCKTSQSVRLILIVQNLLLKIWVKQFFMLSLEHDPDSRLFNLQKNEFKERQRATLVEHLKSQPNTPQITMHYFRYESATREYEVALSKDLSLSNAENGERNLKCFCSTYKLDCPHLLISNFSTLPNGMSITSTATSSHTYVSPLKQGENSTCTRGLQGTCARLSMKELGPRRPLPRRDRSGPPCEGFIVLESQTQMSSNLGYE